MASRQINISMSLDDYTRVTSLSAAAGLPLATWVKARLLHALEVDEQLEFFSALSERQRKIDALLLERVNAIFAISLDGLPAEKAKAVIDKARANVDAFIAQIESSEA